MMITSLTMHQPTCLRNEYEYENLFIQGLCKITNISDKGAVVYYREWGLGNRDSGFQKNYNPPPLRRTKNCNPPSDLPVSVGGQGLAIFSKVVEDI